MKNVKNSHSLRVCGPCIQAKCPLKALIFGTLKEHINTSIFPDEISALSFTLFNSCINFNIFDKCMKNILMYSQIKI